MKAIQILNRVACALLLIVAVSCTNNDIDENGAGAGSSSPVANAELNEALADLGFSLDKDGQLIINDAVRSTTSLDLSGAGLLSLEGLNFFSALEAIDIRDNEFGSSVDLKYLPASVRTVDLRGNESIARFDNLARSYTKITLPHSAKWNTAEVLAYVVANPAVELSYAEGDSIVRYTTEREIPDQTLRELLQGLYPSLFEGDKVVLTNAFKESNVELVMEQEIANLEGVEYIIGRAEYCSKVAGAKRLMLLGESGASYAMGAVSLSANITHLTLRNVDSAAVVDLSNLVGLKYLDIESNASLERVVLPSTFLRSDIAATNVFDNVLRIALADKLSAIENLDHEGGIGRVELRELSALATLDLSQITMVHTIILESLPAVELSMPSHLGRYCDGWGGESSSYGVVVALDDAAKAQADVERFLKHQGECFQIYDFSNYYLN